MKSLETQRKALSFHQWFTRLATCNDKLTITETKPLGVEAQFLRGLEFEGGEGVVQDYAQASALRVGSFVAG